MRLKQKFHITLADMLLLFCFFIVFSLLLSNVFVVRGEKTVLQKVVRLHVLANSDSDQDQRVKYAVRDEIVLLTSELFDDCKSASEAKDIAQKNKDKILSCAQKVVKDQGFSYPVFVQLGVETYPVRRYGELTFPAGDYFSVRVKLGKARGKNWWCVLFPPLCSSVYVSDEKRETQALSEYGFTNSEIESLGAFSATEEKTVVKFKIAELLGL